MTIRKRKSSAPDEMRAEYDFSKMKGLERGRYYERYKAGTNLILIEPEIFAVFPNREAVNNALRSLIRAKGKTRVSTRAGAKASKPARASH